MHDHFEVRSTLHLPNITISLGMDHIRDIKFNQYRHNISFHMLTFFPFNAEHRNLSGQAVRFSSQLLSQST